MGIQITDKILPVPHKWQQWPLGTHVRGSILGAIHYHVYSKRQIVKKVVYIAIVVNLDDRKDVLGMRVGKNGSARSGRLCSMVRKRRKEWQDENKFNVLPF